MRGGKPCALPRQWLFTDPARQPDLAAVLARLPPDTGVVFRHYGVPNRAQLAQEAAGICRRRGLPMLVAGADSLLPCHASALGRHLPQHQVRKRRRGSVAVVSAACHDMAAIVAAARAGAMLVFLSPVFATQSHPEGLPLGPLRFAALAKAAHQRGLIVYALGGLGAERFRRLRGLPVSGFGAIGYFGT